MIAALLLACGAEDRTAESCGGCHTEQYEAWLGSAHAESGSSEVFLAMLPEVRAAWGAPAEERCRACHQPGFGGDEGIGCVSCHQAVGNRTESDGTLVVDLSAPIAGPHPGRGAPHAVSQRAFLRDPALCATCHEVTGPALLVERTGSEHAALGGGETCADCHLPGGDHSVQGFAPGADPDAARELLADALALRIASDPPAVEVENVGAGHRVPTGAAFLRELRVDVAVIGADGARLDWPGLLDLAPRPVADGIPVALLTEATAIEGEGLAPGEIRRAEIPLDGVPAPARIEATLVFRAYRQEVLDALRIEADVPEIAVARIP